jgi:hypothetical protein
MVRRTYSLGRGSLHLFRLIIQFELIVFWSIDIYPEFPFRHNAAKHCTSPSRIWARSQTGRCCKSGVFSRRAQSWEALGLKLPLWEIYLTG